MLQNYILVGIKASNRYMHWLKLMGDRNLFQGKVQIHFLRFWITGTYFTWSQTFVQMYLSHFYRTTFGLASRFTTVLNIECSCCESGGCIKLKCNFFFTFWVWVTCVFLNDHDVDVHNLCVNESDTFYRTTFWLASRFPTSVHRIQLIWTRKLHQGKV